MAKKKAAKKGPGGKREGAGRKQTHGEETVMISGRFPISVVEIADMIGPTRTLGLIAMAKQSVQYRLEHRSGELLSNP